MERSQHGSDNLLRKGPRSPEEDEILISFIRVHGLGQSWTKVPRLAGLRRSAQSCRLRWNNYLRPGLRQDKFSMEEELLVIELHSVLGNSWSTIANQLPGRTNTAIKNFWNTQLRKKLLRMGIDPTTHRPILSNVFETLFGELLDELPDSIREGLLMKQLQDCINSIYNDLKPLYVDPDSELSDELLHQLVDIRGLCWFGPEKLLQDDFDDELLHEPPDIPEGLSLTWPEKLLQDDFDDELLHEPPDIPEGLSLTWPEKLLQDDFDDELLHEPPDIPEGLSLTWPEKLLQDDFDDELLHEPPDIPEELSLTWPEKLLQDDFDDELLHELPDIPEGLSLTWPEKLLLDDFDSNYGGFKQLDLDQGRKINSDPFSVLGLDFDLGGKIDSEPSVGYSVSLDLDLAQELGCEPSMGNNLGLGEGLDMDMDKDMDMEWTWTRFLGPST